MKKIKISELPLFSSLRGLYTIGTDSENRSVKVSLEFIEQQTTEAVSNANAATQAAITAKNNAETATSNAQAATSAAATATQNAVNATQAAQTATENANAATQAAEGATAAAQYAAERVIALIGQLVPTALVVEYLPRLTLGNVQPVYIEATLTPSNAMKNIIFISDGKAVTVSPDGRLSIVGKGRSTIQVIPTINTALAKVIQIEVGEPTARLHTRSSLRLTSARAFRLN